MSAKSPWHISRKLGPLRWDRTALVLLILIALVVAGWRWLAANPGHNPWAPLDLRDPMGWATERKIRDLRGEAGLCRTVLQRSEVAFEALPSAGEGPCRREDSTRLRDTPLSPGAPATSCAVAAATHVWLEQGVQPAARAIYGQGVARIEHLGAFSCRRLYGADEGPWSEHATANAIDIAAFVLEDGSRITVLKNWEDADDDARFLQEVRDAACGVFATVLSPDYNAAHRDHFHLDQRATGYRGVCR